MKITTAQLKQKALGFIKAIDSIPSKDRQQAVSEALAKDYNRLLDLTIEASPDLSTLVPPKIEIVTIQRLHFKDRTVGKASINELNVFCQQLVNFLQ